MSQIQATEVRDDSAVCLKVDRLNCHFNLGKRFGFFGSARVIKAVNNISFEIGKGKALGLVGESGCGKSSTAAAILNIHAVKSGRVLFEGQNLMELTASEWRKVRKRIQYVFQDPLGALDPRMTILNQVIEPLIIHGIAGKAKRQSLAENLMREVGLRRYLGSKYPHELSGGQRQRVVLARALILEPSMLICDEPISALDVSIQAQVINLLDKLRKDRDITLLFISHDLSVVRYLCDWVAVMYMGGIVESAHTDLLFDNPLHPYTKALIASIPIPEPGAGMAAQPLMGEPPSVLNPPAGCRFHPRCPIAMEICSRVTPDIEMTGDGRKIACHGVDKGAIQ